MSILLSRLYTPLQANGRVAAYTYEERPPSAWLAPYVSCFWFSAPAERPGESRPGAVDRVLPDCCTDLLFVSDVAGGSGRILYCGLFDRPFAIDYDPLRPAVKFGVRFFPGGAYALLGIPGAEFAGSHVEAEAIRPGLRQRLGESVFAACGFEERIRLVERYFAFLLAARRPADDDTTDNALHTVLATKGQIAVSELAAREAVGVRRLHRLFLRRVGTGPKRFGELIRFQAAVRELSRATALHGTRLAADLGYADQSHLIRDFRRFYGDTPSVAFREFRGASDSFNAEPGRSRTMDEGGSYPKGE